MDNNFERIDELEQQVQELGRNQLAHLTILNTLVVGLRDVAIQLAAVAEDAKDWPYDRSALAKRREKARSP